MYTEEDFKKDAVRFLQLGAVLIIGVLIIGLINNISGL